MERVFSYDFDSLISNRNRLTADSLQFVKLHSAFDFD